MTTSINPYVSGVFSLFAGDLVGSLTDRVSLVLEQRLHSNQYFNLSGDNSLLDVFLGTFINVGLITLGTEILDQFLFHLW